MLLVCFTPEAYISIHCVSAGNELSCCRATIDFFSNVIYVYGNMFAYQDFCVSVFLIQSLEGLDNRQCIALRDFYAS